MKTPWLALAALGSGLFALAAQADDWPQWRGPKRDGISQEKNLLQTWPKEGPKLLWQARDIGSGYGSVTAANERLYLVANQGMENEFVTALDAKTGKPLWTTRLGNVGNPKQFPPYAAARSTPTVDGNLLYALGSDGDLACLETATGKMKWQKSLRADFGGKPGMWAYSESPLVDGDQVVVAPGGEQATLIALNKKTGEVRWKSAVPGGDMAAYASTIRIVIGGVPQYVQYLGKGLVGVEAKTGKFLWRYDKIVDFTGANMATPIAVGNRIYSASGGKAAVTELRESGGTTAVEAVYVAGKAPYWLGGSVKVGDYLYGTTKTALLCIEFATGKVLWEERSIGAGSVCYADGRLYLHGENGEVALIEATPEGYKELGRFTPPDLPARGTAKAWQYPAVANGVLYIRDIGTLWAYDIRAAQ